MRLALHLICLAATATTAAAQAPKAASLWDVPATTLSKPAPLETGVTASFWNPAAAFAGTGLGLGVQAIQTPETLGLSGVLAGLTYPLGQHLAVGLIFGRVQIGDLVRTSTSPVSQPGEIPVYEQAGGIAAATRVGPLTLAALFRGHDAQFDVFREGGLSADLGARVTPFSGFTLAAATRFVPVRTSSNQTASYHGAVEYRPFSTTLWGAQTTVVARYGAQFRSSGGVDHTVGAGIGLGSKLALDAACVRETAYGEADWRVIFALSVRAGRYDVIAARGSGLRGVGGNYRVGIEVDFDR